MILEPSQLLRAQVESISELFRPSLDYFRFGCDLNSRYVEPLLFKN